MRACVSEDPGLVGVFCDILHEALWLSWSCCCCASPQICLRLDANEGGEELLLLPSASNSIFVSKSVFSGFCSLSLAH